MFWSKLIKYKKTSCKNTDAVIYYIKYITMKRPDHINIACADCLYLVFSNVDRYIIKESNEDK